MFGNLTYLVLELGWALPVLFVQWGVGWPELWHARRSWFLATTLPTCYLAAADRLALGDGIWRISERLSTGIALFGLPLEEALFFLLTNMMVVQALILFNSPATLARLQRWLGALKSRLSAGGEASPGTAGSATKLPAEPGRSRWERTSWTAVVAAGYRCGMFGGVAGGLLSTIMAAVLAVPSALEPLAQAVMQWTPIPVANVLMQRLGPAARPLALLGALGILLVVGGGLGVIASLCSSLGPRQLARPQPAQTGEVWQTSRRRWRGMGTLVALMALAGLTVGLAAESAPLPALAYFAGQAPFLSPPILWHGRRSQGARAPVAAPRAATRRRLLGDTAGVVSGAGGIVGVTLFDAARRDQRTEAGGRQVFPFAAPAARAAGFPLEGQLPEVTPVPQFYVVSKNAQDPAVDARLWRLRISGLAQRPFSVGLDELMSLPRRDEFVTFQCVSNPVGGSLISNAFWSGVSLAALLERAAPQATAGRVVFRAPDGHEESIPLDVAWRAENLVAYAMNGELLTRLHGHPARAVLPGLYGFKQVKWLTQIELAPQTHRGYWPRRGWTDEAVVRTTARIDLVRREGNAVRLAGMAFAGRRSLSAVEVRVGPIGELGASGSALSAGSAATAPTGASGWSPAELHLPPLSPMTWIQWRALLPTPAPAAGELFAEARAVDGEGRPQDSALEGPFPNGASGFHRVPVKG